MPVPADDVPSIPYRVLTLLTLGAPLLLVASVLAVMPITALGVLSPRSMGMGSGSPGISGAAVVLSVVLFGVFGVALLLAVAIPALLFLDAKKLQTTDIEWQPNPVLYAVLGFLFTGLTLLHYLYKRQAHVIEWEDTDWWWIGLPLAAVVPLVFGAVGYVLPGSVGAGVAAVSGLAFLLPVALVPVLAYKDASYVRLNSADWQPNPMTHYVVGIAAAAFSIVGLVPYLGYYLYKRHTAVGTP
jgi:hypothetical protein